MTTHISPVSIRSQLGPNHDEWVLALDLLIARATLDEELRTALLKAPQQTCLSNGVIVPEGVQVLITRADQPTLIREIPTTLPSASFEKTAATSYVREPVVYNGTTESTEVETTESAAAETTVGAVAEAIVVLT
ncbi:MAG: hypothetical protein EBU88_15305 [Acidobacteria bacterium]|nr:hypothetical protein [Acidobacteriota bacterium]